MNKFKRANSESVSSRTSRLFVNFKFSILFWHLQVVWHPKTCPVPFSQGTPMECPMITCSVGSMASESSRARALDRVLQQTNNRSRLKPSLIFFSFKDIELLFFWRNWYQFSWTRSIAWCKPFWHFLFSSNSAVFYEMGLRHLKSCALTFNHRQMLTSCFLFYHP